HRHDRRRRAAQPPDQFGPLTREDTNAGRGACCNVEMSASVDSAPWLRFGPVGVNPSYPPFVSAFHITAPPSLSPANQSIARETPRRHSSSRVTTWARAQASAIAATSIGCWSKRGGASSRPAPPTGVGDR